MAESSIEWTDATWNPVRGCSRVSAGCDNCYAMGQAHRFAGPGKPYEGLTTIRRGKVDWAGKARLVTEMLSQPLKWKKPRRVFVNSMSDLFHESLSFEEIAAVFGVMAACPQHTFQVLTKRPKRALEFFAWHQKQAESDGDAWIPIMREAMCWLPEKLADLLREGGRARDGVPELEPWPLPNVHLGVSVEDQKTADERIPLLLQCPAAVHWVSYEPALGPVDLSRYFDIGAACECVRGEPSCENMGSAGWIRCNMGLRRIRWVVVGGESGRGARPFNVEWARAVLRQAAAAPGWGKTKKPCPVFVKQLGAHPFEGAIQDTHPRCFRDAAAIVRFGVRHKKGADMSEWPSDLRVRQFPEARR